MGREERATMTDKRWAKAVMARNQQWLWASLDDLVAPDNPVRFLDAVLS